MIQIFNLPEMNSKIVMTYLFKKIDDKIENLIRKEEINFKKQQIAIIELIASAFEQIGAKGMRFDLPLETSLKCGQNR
jgi:hypothetical protein